jgi:hypothetical protein
MTVHLTVPTASHASGSDSTAGPSSSDEASPLSEEANEAGLRSVSLAIRSARRIVFLTGKSGRFSSYG